MDVLAVAITQKILHTIYILVGCFKYFTPTPVLCGDARDQRSLWFCQDRVNCGQEQTILILCYFYLLYRLWPVLKLEELKTKSTIHGCEVTMLKRTISSLLLVPRSVYSGNRKMQKIRMLLLL